MSEAIAHYERQETLRLADLGFFKVTGRMKSTGLVLDSTVTSISFDRGELSIVAGGQAYTVRPESVEFRTIAIRVWILEAGERKCAVTLSATVDDRFIAEVNPGRVSMGLPPIITPAQHHADDARRQDEFMASLAEPLADKTVGKTVAGVRALDPGIRGYELVFTDGTSVVIHAGIRDYDVAVVLVDDEEPRS